MEFLDKIIETLSLPGFVVTTLIVCYALLQLIGEAVEIFGKLVPEFLKIRKFFARKKKEKQAQAELIRSQSELIKSQSEVLGQVQTLITDFNNHYSNDNIEKRNDWIAWVNDRAKVYDASVQDLKDLHKTIADSSALTLDLYINVNRNRIIDFASKVANENIIISKEEFNRIFKIYKEYEEVLAKHKMTNGEVDISYKVIQEAYVERLKDNSFLEDIRGYK